MEDNACYWIQRIEQEQYLQHDVLYPYTMSMLKHYGKNADLILVTARNNEDAIRKQIRDLGIEQHFERVYVVPSGKQTPELKANILRDNGVELFIGDTESDLRAAELAKCQFYAVTSGFRTINYWKNVVGFSLFEELNEKKYYMEG